MAEPVVDDAAFPKGLHKKKGYKDQGTVTGTGIAKGQAVKVTGHNGKKPTVWTGKVGDPTDVAKTWAIEVTVKHEQQRAADDKKDRDAEDVSTTVTNSSNEESQPVNTPAVPIA
jgi:hypothetical protein